jgi:polyisoprenyl-phosphate glycosyltransferase
LSVLFLGGVQLISIGIIGEYISRLSDNVRNRPLYIINDTNITGPHEKQGYSG